MVFPTVAFPQNAAVPLSNNGELNEELFPGASVAERVNAAVLSCGTSVPCVVLLPDYAPIW